MSWLSTNHAAIDQRYTYKQVAVVKDMGGDGSNEQEIKRKKKKKEKSEKEKVAEGDGFAMAKFMCSSSS